MTLLKTDYFLETDKIGLYVLLNSIKQQPFLFDENQGLNNEFINLSLSIIMDDRFMFFALKRLKDSIESNERTSIAVDATSFFLFQRILYDSFAALMHNLFKVLNPSDSRKWPTKNSFNDFLKWLEKRRDPYFDELKRATLQFDFKAAFEGTKNIRDKLKRVANENRLNRMMWYSMDWFPVTGNLRNEIGYYLYSVLLFMDYLGDYFFMKIEEKYPIIRLENDPWGFERGHLSDEQKTVYKWFNTSLPLEDYE